MAFKAGQMQEQKSGGTGRVNGKVLGGKAKKTASSGPPGRKVLGAQKRKKRPAKKAASRPPFGAKKAAPDGKPPFGAKKKTASGFVPGKFGKKGD